GKIVRPFFRIARCSRLALEFLSALTLLLVFCFWFEGQRHWDVLLYRAVQHRKVDTAFWEAVLSFGMNGMQMQAVRSTAPDPDGILAARQSKDEIGHGIKFYRHAGSPGAIGNFKDSQVRLLGFEVCWYHGAANPPRFILWLAVPYWQLLIVPCGFSAFA